jgi:hypothetical protein
MSFGGRLRTGEKIAQMAPMPVLIGPVQAVTNLEDSARADRDSEARDDKAVPGWYRSQSLFFVIFRGSEPNRPRLRIGK